MQPLLQGSPGGNPARYHLLAVITLALVSILAYLPVSVADLLAWDTQKYVNENRAIHDINSSSLLWMLTQTYNSNWHPLTFLSHALDIQFFGFAPFGHHWVNVAWHIACAWLLYLYSQRLLPRLLPSRFADGMADLYRVSLFAALLFALHPQHVESVAWVAERKDLLCGFFYLLCLYSYDSYVTRPGTARYLVTVCCAAAAIMAKPMAVSLPVVLLVFDLLLYQRVQVHEQVRLLFWRSHNWRIVVVEKSPFVLLAMLSVFLTVQAQALGGSISTFDLVSGSHRLTTSVINWVEYLLTTLIPLGTSPYYPYEFDIPWPKFWLCLVGLVSVLLVAEYYRRRKTAWIMLAVLYYSLTLLPVIGIVQIGSMKAADRYTYLPTIPLYLIVAVAIYLVLKWSLNKKRSAKYAIAWITGLLLLPAALGFSTHQYTRIWENDITLWSFVIETQKADIFPYIYLAEAYYHDKRYEEALPYYRLAWANRNSMSPDRSINIFVSRYYDTAYQLEYYAEANQTIYTGMLEKRLWFLPRGEIYYNAALINMKLSDYGTALELIDMALREGGDTEKFQLRKKRIVEFMETQP